MAKWMNERYQKKQEVFFRYFHLFKNIVVYIQDVCPPLLLPRWNRIVNLLEAVPIHFQYI